ncbi:hypothetical protein D9M72_522080 [compost metagenome]
MQPGSIDLFGHIGVPGQKDAAGGSYVERHDLAHLHHPPEHPPGFGERYANPLSLGLPEDAGRFTEFIPQPSQHGREQLQEVQALRGRRSPVGHPDPDAEPVSAPVQDPLLDHVRHQALDGGVGHSRGRTDSGQGKLRLGKGKSVKDGGDLSENQQRCDR